MNYLRLYMYMQQWECVESTGLTRYFIDEFVRSESHVKKHPLNMVSGQNDSDNKGPGQNGPNSGPFSSFRRTCYKGHLHVLYCE